MGFLSWMKKDGAKAPEKANPITVNNRTPLQQLFAEWTHDQQLAKVRDATGREPESGQIKPSPDPAVEHRKSVAKKERLKSRDIPF